MKLDTNILAEAIAMLRALPSDGRRRALRSILAAYPAARVLLRRPE